MYALCRKPQVLGQFDSRAVLGEQTTRGDSCPGFSLALTAAYNLLRRPLLCQQPSLLKHFYPTIIPHVEWEAAYLPPGFHHTSGIVSEFFALDSPVKVSEH